MKALAAVLLLAVPTAARADALQDRVLASARAAAADRYAFRRTTRLERSGAPAKTVEETYDPRRAADGGWSLLSVDGRPPTAKDLSGWRKQGRRTAPSYSEIAKWFGGPAAVALAGPGRVLYRFARLPDGAVKVNGRDLSADTQGEALVNAAARVPFVERVRLRSTKGFRVMMVARMDSMLAESRYRQLPDGRVVPDGGDNTVTGSLMGKAGTLKASLAYFDVRPAR